MCVCVCVCVCLCVAFSRLGRASIHACARSCVRACVPACVRACVSACARVSTVFLCLSSNVVVLAFQCPFRFCFLVFVFLFALVSFLFV